MRASIFSCSGFFCSFSCFIFFFRFTVLMHSIRLCWVVGLPTDRPHTHTHTNTITFICLCFWCGCSLLPLFTSDLNISFDMFCATVRLPMCARCKLMRDFRVPTKNVIQPSTCQCVLCGSSSEQHRTNEWTNGGTKKKILLQRDDWEPFNVFICIKQHIILFYRSFASL